LSDAETPDAPTIEIRKNGPLRVANLRSFRLPDGTEAEPKPVLALCRCGKSGNKPYCDGSHRDAGFDGASADVAHRDRIHQYKGQEATVYFNKLLCSHAGECGKRALNVFNPKQKPWVKPDEGNLEQIEEVVANCPSGALRYSLPLDPPVAITGDDVSISTEANGPYHVHNIPIEADYWAEGQSSEKYVLCRCGLSKNKPFCDGTHYDVGWKDSDEHPVI
jgi:CDGSH-type Zn-finger protein